MNIVYFLRDVTDCGGIQQTTCNTINMLLKKKKDYRVTTISLYHKFSKPFFFIDSKVNNIALFNKQVSNKWSFFNIRKKLKKALGQIEYNLLVVQGIMFSAFIPKSIWSQKKVISCEHGYYGMGAFFSLHTLGSKASLNKADAIVTLTEADKNIYQSRNKNGILIKNIPNCFFPLDFIPVYKQDSKTIVSVGRLDSIKQFDQVVKAARIVFSRYPDWKWEIYGDGPNRESLQKQIKEYDLAEKVILCGHQEDKRFIFEDKSFLVLTSKFEGFGMVLLEALQYKLPLISYDVKFGPKEIVQDGVNGYLITANNVQKLADKVSWLIENREQRLFLSQNAEKTITRYSRENVINLWIDLFESIVNK